MFTPPTDAQSVVPHYDNRQNFAYINIVPIKVVFDDNDSAYRLYVCEVKNDLSTTAVLYWELQDTVGSVKLKSNGSDAIITGGNYSSLTGNNSYPFTFMLNSLSLTSAGK